MPLLAHSILCALLSDAVERVIVSTDSDEIAEIAMRYGAAVPFLRPAELAGDTAAMWPVVQHALRTVEQLEQVRYGAVLLLDPTSPGRLPQDIGSAVALLDSSSVCDGVVSVSEPEFNPLWHCVVEQDGYMRDLIPGSDRYVRRQEVPAVYRINAALYLWRRDFVLATDNWRSGRLRMWEIPEQRAIHIDDLHQFELADHQIRTGAIRLPWVS
jgi:N-acylneuraminate cytidylyltransferase